MLRLPGVVTLLVVACMAVAGCGESLPPADPGGPTAEQLARAIEALRPLQTKLAEPRPGDWLAKYDEAGQTFAEYLDCDPVVPSGRRRIIYIQPLGEFTGSQRKIFMQAAEFMRRFYNRPVTVCEDLSLEVIPASARRSGPLGGALQILSTYVLDEVLKPRLPDDAAACIALTATDLWPGRGWNFVFGQASLRERVGVWSIRRFGDPDVGEAAYRRCLLRAIGTAVHETGHMFSMQHCTAWECGMCGSNSLPESDRRHLWFCSECMAKVCWATGADPVKRCRRLAEFCRDAGLDEERRAYERTAETLAPLFCGADVDGGEKG